MMGNMKLSAVEKSLIDLGYKQSLEKIGELEKRNDKLILALTVIECDPRTPDFIKELARMPFKKH